MKRTLFARYALLIVCFVCFWGPFALRGARMSMQRMTNRVKDWLPSDFAETSELEWFGRHFMGEQFVIVTWPGCSEDDPRYQKLVDRIQHQIAPPEHHETGRPDGVLPAPARKPFEELTPAERLTLDRQRAGELGDQLGLCTVGESELDARSDGNGFVKTRVAFLGLSDPAEGPAKPAADNTDNRAGPPAVVGGQPTVHDLAADRDRKYQGPGPIDQTQLFSQTLKDLMTCAGVHAKAGSWHNPGKVLTEPGFYSSDAWAKLLREKFDCVVMVRDNPAYDVEFIKQHVTIFIDARQHQFQPSSPQAETAAQRSDPIHVVYTGVVPLVYKAQRSLLDSLIQSTFWSFITITPLMMFLARNVIAGIVVMLPNVLPVVVIFGSMGLLNIDVDVGSMMTASIALGVAVDDTIHFLTWYRQDFERLGDRKQAILAAYRRCALPTMQAAAISGLGLSVFALSTFTPTQRFGYLMLTILLAGLVAELIMLPALLAGPLGRFCSPRQSMFAAADQARYVPGRDPGPGHPVSSNG